MGDLAVAVIVGRLTRDAELKYANSGTAICHFSIATNARVKKGDQWVDESSYWDVDLFGKRAESVNQYLTKGKLVAVQGDMRQDRWEQDGQQKSKVKITANDVQLLGTGQGGGSAPEGAAEAGGSRAAPQYGQNSRAPAPSRSPQGAQPPRGGQGPAGGDDFTDDIPF